MNACAGRWLLIACGLLGLASPVRGADPAANQAPPVRRVYAPADDVSRWPLGAQRYLPMERDTFERLLRESSAPNADKGSGRAPRLIEARYSARLEAEAVLSGDVTWNVKRSEAAPSLLPLGGCNLALADGQWMSAKPEPAVLGLHTAGQTALLVDRDLPVRFAWSLRGRTDQAGGVHFSVRLPACAVTRWTLDLPADTALLSDVGVVTRLEAAPSGRRRWQLDLGGYTQAELSVTASDAKTARQAWAEVRQASVYDCSLHGVDISVQLTVDAQTTPVREISLLLDPGLKLLVARYGDRILDWSLAPAEEGVRRVTVRLPQPLRGAGHVVRLWAIAPVTTATTWRLPRIRPEGLFWQLGSATLLVPFPLSLERLKTEAGRQTGIGPLTGQRTGESVQLELFSPDSQIDVLLARREPRVQLVSALSAQIDGGEVRTQTVADFRVSEGEEFALLADVGRSWIVDGLEALPADALDSWTIETLPGKGKGKSEPPTQLRVLLAKAIAPARPLRLKILARRLFTPTTRRLSSEDLAPVRFVGPSERRLVSVRAASSYLLQVTGDEALQRLEYAALAAADRDLFGAEPGGLLFADNAAASGARFGLQPRRAAYAATLRVDAIVSAGLLQETYRLQCVPEKARVERLLVHFSQGRDVPLRWTLAASVEPPVLARRLPAEQQIARGMSPDEELWEVTLPEPLDKPFELRAARVLRPAAAQVVSLVELPEASQQQGVVAVRGNGSGDPQIRSVRIRPAPPEEAALPGFATPLAAFRYDPARDVSSALVAPLTLLTSSAAGAPAAWLWSQRLLSRYQADGSAVHVAVYRIQNCGRESLRFSLPEQVRPDQVLGVWVNAQRIATRAQSAGKRQQLVVGLSDTASLVDVTIGLNTESGRLGASGRLDSPLPDPGLTAVRQEWMTWLPPGYEIASEQSDGRSGWLARWLGPLARPGGQPRWTPWNDDAWSLGGLLPWAADVVPADPSQEPMAAVGSWPHPARDGWMLLDQPQGRPQRVECSGPEAARLAYVHRPALRLFGVASLLAAAAGAAWMLRGRRPVFLSVLAVAAVVALAIDARYMAIGSGVLLGLLAGAAWRVVFRRPEKEETPPLATSSDSVPSTRSRITTVGTAMLLAGLAALAASRASGQTSAPRPAAAAPRYDVFIPTDDRQQPTGGAYLVPEELYRRLHRQSGASAWQGWLMTSAEYKGTLTWQAAAERLGLSQLAAEFRLQVLSAPARVRIPFARDTAQPVPEETRLDGRPVPLTWEPDGAAFTFDVNAPGIYRLQVGLRPKLQTTGAETGVDMPIPPVACAKLELGLPGGSARVDVPSALGQVRREENPPRLTADLGPASRLSIQWGSGGRRSGGRNQVDVDEFLWLKIQPNAVLVDVRFQYRVRDGRLNELPLAVDPALRMATATPAAPPVSGVRSAPGHPQVLRMDLVQPVIDRVQLEATFRLSGASGAGNLRLPFIESLEARRSRRWLAVSVDPAIAYEVQASPAAATVAPPDFLAEWGASDAQPQAAYRLPPPQAGNWTIALKPRKPQISAEQVLAMSIAPGAAELNFDAQLNTSGGYCFEHRLLLAPANVQIDKVSVLQENTQRAARWTLAPNGELTVFLNASVSGPHKLSWHGRISAPARGQIVVPRVDLPGCTVASSQIQVYRQAAVTLKPGTAAGTKELTGTSIPVVHPQWGRLFKVFQVLPGATPKITLQGAANVPKVFTNQTITVRQDRGAWNAELDIHLDVQQGAIDSLQIDAPLPWSGAYRLDPPEPVQVIERKGEGRYLLVRPRAEIKGTYRLRISAGLAASGARPTLPAIGLKTPKSTRKIVVLPQQAAGQTLSWEIQGLEPIEQLAKKRPAGEGPVTLYQARGETYRAALRSGSTTAESADVALTELLVSSGRDGQSRALCVHHLRPRQAESCLLVVDPATQLLHVSVSGVPVAAEPLEQNRWRIPLPFGALPQTVEILFVQPRDPDSTRHNALAPPCIEGAPTRQLLLDTWPGPVPESVAAPAAKIGPEEAALLRWQALVELLEAAATLPDVDKADLSAWYRQLAARLSMTRRDADQRMAQATAAAAAPLRNEIQKLQQRQVRAVEQLVSLGLDAGSATSGGEGNAASSIWYAEFGPAASAFLYKIDSSSDANNVAAAPVRACDTQRSPPWMVWIGLVVAIVALGWASRWGLLSALAIRAPRMLVVLLGLAWWLWMWPSALGWLLVLGSLLSWIGQAWIGFGQRRRAAVIQAQDVSP